MSLSLLCVSSILHARRHSSQQVCRHRITGQQLSEHPAADTGRRDPGTRSSLCVRVGRKLVCFDCDYRSNSGNLLTEWMHAKIFLIPRIPETCCWVSSTSPLTPSHSAPAVCAFVHLYFTVRVWFTICAPLFIWHIWSRPFRQQAFSRAASLFPPLAFYFLLSALSRSPPSLLFIFSLCLVLSPSFTFFPHRSAPRSYASSITTSTFLISVQPHPPGASSAPLCSSTHGNHLKLLC